jgi:GNAT superfamily N-acetyltransferase
MQVVPLTAENMEIFTKYTQDHITDYLFFVLDYKYYPEQTQISMAVDQYHNILGMAMIFKNRLLSLRGSDETIKILLKYIKTPVKEIMVPIQARKMVEPLILPNSRVKEMLRMTLKEEHLIPNVRDFSQIKILIKSEAEDVVHLMQLADPGYWGDKKRADILFDDVNVWYGKRQNNQLISIAGVWKDPNASLITVVATHPQHQNQGHASDLMHYALQQNLLETSSVFLHVRANNSIAIHTYKRIGFMEKGHYINVKFA